MSDGYELIDVADAELTLSEKSGTRNIDFGDVLGCEKLRPRMWFVEPGHDRKRYHSHEQQEEFYYVLSGPGRMRIAGEDHTIPEGTAIRIPPGTKRKTFNDTDREHVWLVVGAPAVDDPGIVHEEE